MQLKAAASFGFQGEICSEMLGASNIGRCRRAALTRNILVSGDALGQLDPIGGMGMTPGASCEFKALGLVTIRDISKPVELASKVTRRANQTFMIDGTATFNWLAYGLQDPSIFIAKVHPTVKVNVHLELGPDKTP
jgi:hypothetical protein